MSMNKYTNQIMANISAFKMDGLGNDFLIIDRRIKNTQLTKEKIIELADRKKIGFDQIIFLEKEIKNQTPITIFNSDSGWPINLLNFSFSFFAISSDFSLMV